MNDFSAGPLDHCCRRVDVPSIGEPKTKVFDTARFPEILRSLLQNEDISRAGSLSLKEILLPIDGDHPEHVVIELKRSVEIADGESEMGESERWDH